MVHVKLMSSGNRRKCVLFFIYIYFFFFILATLVAEELVNDQRPDLNHVLWGCNGQLHGSCKGRRAAEVILVPCFPLLRFELYIGKTCSAAKNSCGAITSEMVYNILHFKEQRTSCWPLQPLTEGGNSFYHCLYFKDGETEAKKSEARILVKNGELLHIPFLH